VDRRSFLRRAGAAALTVVAAPLFIPSERLDFGVPKARALLVPEPETLKLIGGEVSVYLPAEDWGDDDMVKVYLPKTTYPEPPQAMLRRGPVTLAEAAQFYQGRGESALMKMFAEQATVLAALPFQKIGWSYRDLYGEDPDPRYMPNLDSYRIVEPEPLTRVKREILGVPV
jgi:hypothetical protein